ncbi:MAG: hypothetical protein ABIF17_02850 [Patescibacteria group bacterium]
MTKDKWLDLVQMVGGKFGIIDRFQENLGDDIPGTKDVLVFESPILGKVKLEWVERAKFIREDTTYSRRIGSNVKIEKVYDENEKVSYLKAYKWDEVSNDWAEIEVEKTFSF